MLRLAVLFCAFAAYSAAPSNRIVNGTDANIKDYPYAVSLRGSTNSHICGASIISENWLLTAAHCVEKKVAQNLTIQYGVTKISKNGSTIAKVKKIIYHELFGVGDNYINDIAVLELSEPLSFNEFVRPIPLPKNYTQTKHGSSAVLVGWGRNASDGIIQEHLKQLYYKIVGQKECAELHESQDYDPVYESQFCAAFPGNGKGQCNGDSGGPLTVDGIQVGIVSWSISPCGSEPGVLTQVSYFRDWIKNHTGV